MIQKFLHNMTSWHGGKGPYSVQVTDGEGGGGANLIHVLEMKLIILYT